MLTSSPLLPSSFPLIDRRRYFFLDKRGQQAQMAAQMGLGANGLGVAVQQRMSFSQPPPPQPQGQGQGQSQGQGR